MRNVRLKAKTESAGGNIRQREAGKTHHQSQGTPQDKNRKETTDTSLLLPRRSINRTYAKCLGGWKTKAK